MLIFPTISLTLFSSLSADMVKNKGFLPSGPSEIPVQRNQMKEIIYSLLSACKEPDMESGIQFKADAIIANPPAYGQLLLLMVHFTIPGVFSGMVFELFHEDLNFNCNFKIEKVS